MCLGSWIMYSSNALFPAGTFIFLGAPTKVQFSRFRVVGRTITAGFAQQK